MANEIISYERVGAVGLIRFDDGGANVFNRKSLDAFNAVLDTAEQDEPGALAITGNAKFFSAGMDLKAMPTLPIAELGDWAEALGRLTVRIFMWPRPVVAAVTGHAVAGGACIMLAADRVVATERPIKIGLTEVAVGVPMGGFGMEMGLAHLAPSAHARALMHGELFETEEALAVGFLDETVPDDRVLSRATELATKLAELNHRAYNIGKFSVRGPAAARIEASLDDHDQMAAVFASFATDANIT